MVCVDKKNYTCLCGCNLTTSTLIWGIVFVVGGLGGGGITGGLNFSGFFQFIMGVMMIAVVCQAKSELYRKIVYYAYLVYCGILIISVIIVAILILTIDTGSGDLDDAAKWFLFYILIIWAIIYIPITLIGLQVVYWGWKQL